MNVLKQDDEVVLGRRLARMGEISTAEMELLRASALGTRREANARYDLIREGDAPHAVFLIVSGWAARYKTLEDGRRQTVGFLIPGDLCDLNNALLAEMDHSIGALNSVSYVEIGHDVIAKLSDDHPRIARLLWKQLLATLSIQREWVLNLGQRSAMERIGHLFCEVFVRMRLVGLATQNEIDMPLTQQDIADATGLTSVHVNRTLQEMRSRALITLSHRTLRIADFAALAELSLFTPAYLHLEPANGRRSHRPTVGVALS
jgi:CRP-like cAMP-binding protein